MCIMFYFILYLFFFVIFSIPQLGGGMPSVRGWLAARLEVRQRVWVDMYASCLADGGGKVAAEADAVSRCV